MNASAGSDIIGPAEIPRTEVLGVSVSATTIDDTMAEIERWIATGRRGYICVTGVHGIIESQSDERLRTIHNRASLVVPDGMPVVWMCKALGFGHTRRCYGPDLMRALTARSAEKGWRQFYYGGNDGVAELLADTLRSKHPDLEVAGTHTPPFRALGAAPRYLVDLRRP